MSNNISNRRRQCCTFSDRFTSLFLIASGVIVLVVGLGVGFGYKQHIDDKLYKKLGDSFCSKDGKGFNQYQDSVNQNEDGEYIYRDLTLFHVTNPGGMLAGNKPQITETKPYSHKSYTYDTNLEFPKPGTHEVSEGMITEFNALSKQSDLLESVNIMSGSYLTIITSAGGELKLAFALSGCSTTCIQDVAAAQTSCAAAQTSCAVDFAAAQTSCAVDLANQNTTDLGQVVSTCMQVGEARLAYYNCLDGGHVAGDDEALNFTQCADIESKAFNATNTAALTANEKVSGVVVTKTAGEIAAGYPNALQGFATMAMGYLPAFSSATAKVEAAVTDQEKATANAGLAQVKAGLTQIESYTKGVCDKAAAAVSEAAANGNATSAKDAAIALHCMKRPCTAATRVLVQGAGCFALTPGFVLNTDLKRFEMGNGCGGDLTRNGKVLKYNEQDSYAAWPTAANTAQDFSAAGFPSMPQIVAGKTEIASGQTGDWAVEAVEGFNGLLSPPQLLNSFDELDNGDFAPYEFSEAEGGAETLRLYVTQAKRALTLLTGTKLKQALEQEAAGATSAPSKSPSTQTRRLRGAVAAKGTNVGDGDSDGFSADLQPNAKMQVNVKGLITNRYAVSRASLDTTPGGAMPAGASGVVSLAYQNGFPAWLSLPLFSNAPAISGLTSKVDITRPDGKLVTNQGAHDWSLHTYVDVEPVTGATVNAHKRLMASFAIPLSTSKPQAAATELFSEFVRPMVITPVYYIDEHSTISDADADTLKLAIYANEALRIVLFVLGSLGGMMLLAGLVMFCSQKSEQATAQHAAKADVAGAPIGLVAEPSAAP